MHRRDVRDMRTFHGTAGADETGSEDWGLVRHTADGHRITFGLTRPPDAMRPRLVGWATLAVLLALTALAYTAVRRLLAPLDVIGAGVEAYGRGEFAAPIAVHRDDELGALADRINGMATSLHGMLEAKRALLLAISHELRSPLTRARVNVELLDDSEPRRALLHDLGEMRDLIDNLLESERLAQGHAALRPEPTDLAALATELVGAQFEDCALRQELDDVGGPVRADPTRLRLLLRNLIDNALRHGAGAAEPPAVFLRREADGQIALGVRDGGPGVAADQLSRLGEAFHRPDGARTRATGGVGLGLALARSVAQAHGGTLRIRRMEPGLEVSAVWPPVR
jgi:signal transduction histidine kinase